MTISDQISKMWSDFLAWLSTIVIPDWAGLIGLLPVLVLIGVVGPLLTLGILAWLGYGVTKPRTKVTYDEGTRVAPRDHLGRIIAPEGEPYCPRDGLIYPYGTTRCDRDKTNLLHKPQTNIGPQGAVRHRAKAPRVDGHSRQPHRVALRPDARVVRDHLLRLHGGCAAVRGWRDGAAARVRRIPGQERRLTAVGTAE